MTSPLINLHFQKLSSARGITVKHTMKLYCENVAFLRRKIFFLNINRWNQKFLCQPITIQSGKPDLFDLELCNCVMTGFLFRYKGKIYHSGGGDLANNYRYNGIWTTYKCNDPEKLFESLVPKLEDLIYNITFAFFTRRETRVVVTPENTQGIISTTDRRKYGRCYIVTPTTEMISYGIRYIQVFGKVRIAIYHLAPGMLESTIKTDYKTLRLGQFLDIDVDHEIYEMLEYRGVACNPDVAFRRDVCYYEDLNNITLSKYGCTPPWGSDKTKICKTKAENTSLSTKLNQEWEKIFIRSKW